MRAIALSLILALSACSPPQVSPNTAPHFSAAKPAPIMATGTVLRHANVTSATGVLPRSVDIWLPPSYETAPAKRYPAIYVHDGQTLFDPALSPISGQDWDIDGAMTRLIKRGDIREAIIIGIWSSAERYEDYMPEKAIRPIDDAMRARMAKRPKPFNIDQMKSDSYLRFITAELKPFIDQSYRTQPGRDHTFVMGASMGGLISLYAAMEYPDVFSASAGLSSHLGSADGAVVDYVAANLPNPAQSRLYFDYGDQGVDADWDYAAHHARLDTILKTAGFDAGPGYENRLYPNTGHGEKFWAARIEAPLTFLLGLPKEGQ